MAKEKKNVYTGTGHRKTSVARVTLTPGTGKITINGQDVHDYLPFEVLVMDLCQPLDITNTREMFDVDAKVNVDISDDCINNLFIIASGIISKILFKK